MADHSNDDQQDEDHTPNPEFSHSQLPQKGIKRETSIDHPYLKKPKTHNLQEERETTQLHEQDQNTQVGVESGIPQSGHRPSSAFGELVVIDSEDEDEDKDDELGDFYNGEPVMDCSNEEEEEEEEEGAYQFLDNEDDVSNDIVSRRQQNYTILNEDDIRQLQEEDTVKISNVLSVSKDSASILLRHYNWSVGNVHDAWFADEEKVRTTVGLLQNPITLSSDSEEMICGICFENYRLPTLYTVACGHSFCTSCWKTYITTSIKDGPGCLGLRCPDPSCRAAISGDMINSLVSDEDKEKYSYYLLRSYVEASRKTKWCPAPGCIYAVDFEVGSDSYDVSCNCTYRFCWNCLEEAHSPVDCDTVAKWILKNSAESENVNWILAYSKPCPKCKRPIEKNNGCMHMTCSAPCKYQFCWLCLGNWSDHFVKTGAPNPCNGYKRRDQEGPIDEAEKRREMAKKSIQRYAHYYERWAANNVSRDKAIADLKKMQTVHIEKLSHTQCQLPSQLKFITEAWLQIIECRRVLKWTYAYGFYLNEDEHAKRQFFEYLQGEAESWLEKLHQCAEQDLGVYIKAGGPCKNFTEFRSKLAGLTKVTGNYFENLVRALENGLTDVESRGACSRIISLNGMEGDNKGRYPRIKGTTSRFGGAGIRLVRPTVPLSGHRLEHPTGASSGLRRVHPTDPFTGLRQVVTTVPLSGHRLEHPTDPSFGLRPTGPFTGLRQVGTTVVPLSGHRPEHPTGPLAGLRQVGPTGSSSGFLQLGPTGPSSGNSQEHPTGPWECKHCTFVNIETEPACEVCNHHRNSWSCQHCTYLNGDSEIACQMCNHHR